MEHFRGEVQKNIDQTREGVKVFTFSEWKRIKEQIELMPGEKILYHGTSNIFDEFVTPTGTEEMDVTGGGVVYFHDSIHRASTYKKPKYVCVAKVSESVDYAEQRKKQGLKKKKSRFTSGVLVALPTNIEIIGFIKTDSVR
ncbi:MAG: hypothetical protein ABII02_04590 [Candidatus Magasanikbacteria bacterium]